MLATIPAATVLGVHGQPVVVEVHVSPGLPGFTIVGQPDAPCREARDRVRAAILSTGLVWPSTRVTVNLAPADVKKIGASLDLAIAIGVLVATGQLPDDRVAGRAFLGELGLDGSVRRFPGVVPTVDAIASREVVVPASCVGLAQLLESHQVRAATTLLSVFEALCGTAPWPDVDAEPIEPTPPYVPDMADVRGQPMARFAMEIAAAGAHHVLLCGPPGSGKTMLAERLPGIMPCLTREESVEVLRIHSAAGLDVDLTALPKVVPFRSPHHKASPIGMLGGGSASLRPGELSCAHRGVLFLDELGEFAAEILDSLRQPLERGVVSVSRAKFQFEFPARFLLVAATNPCPCGWASSGGPVISANGERRPVCKCSTAQMQKYARRLSGPFLDRFDLCLEVERPDPGELLALSSLESSATVGERVALARSIAIERQGVTNALLRSNQLDAVAGLSLSSRRLLDSLLRRGEITARGVARIRRVARTIADLRVATRTLPSTRSSSESDGSVGTQPCDLVIGDAADALLTDDDVALALELRRRPSFDGLAA